MSRTVLQKKGVLRDKIECSVREPYYVGIKEKLDDMDYNGSTKLSLTIKKEDAEIVSYVCIDNPIDNPESINDIIEINLSNPGDEIAHCGNGGGELGRHSLGDSQILSRTSKNTILYAQQSIDAIYHAAQTMPEIDFAKLLDSSYTTFAKSLKKRNWPVYYHPFYENHTDKVGFKPKTIFKNTTDPKYTSHLRDLTDKKKWEEMLLQLRLSNNTQREIFVKNELLGETEYRKLSFIDVIGQNNKYNEYSITTDILYDSKSKKILLREFSKDKKQSKVYSPNFSKNSYEYSKEDPKKYKLIAQIKVSTLTKKYFDSIKEIIKSMGNSEYFYGIYCKINSKLIKGTPIPLLERNRGTARKRGILEIIEEPDEFIKKKGVKSNSTFQEQGFNNNLKKLFKLIFDKRYNHLYNNRNNPAFKPFSNTSTLTTSPTTSTPTTSTPTTSTLTTLNSTTSTPTTSTLTTLNSTTSTISRARPKPKSSNGFVFLMCYGKTL